MRKYNGDNLEQITCNKCGETTGSLLGLDETKAEWDAEPYREFDLVYHYGSVLYDFSGVRFDLCEYCVEEIVDGFKIPAESRDHELVQGYTSDGTPFVYGRIEDEGPPTQAQLDEMHDRIIRNGGEE